MSDPLDWHVLDAPAEPVSGGFRQRLMVMGLALLVCAVVIAGRVAAFTCSEGPAFVAAAAEPLTRCTPLAAPRGRILGRDGTVLALDESLVTLDVHYRWLEEPPQPRWLRQQARERAQGARDAASLAAAAEEVLAERRALHARLAALAGMGEADWTAGRTKVQRQVARIKESVRDRLAARAETAANAEADTLTAEREQLATAGDWRGLAWWHVRNLLADEPAPPPAEVTVTEEFDHHTLAIGVSLATVAEIEGHPARYPGVRIGQATRRSYPAGEFAAHLLGYVGEAPTRDEASSIVAAAPSGLRGQIGVERACEALLRGAPGELVEVVERGGRLLEQRREREPVAGRDVTLTIDPALQRAAESLLDSAVLRARPRQPADTPGGGAAVVLDVRTGAVLAIASAPRFNPGAFIVGDAEELARLIQDAQHPLYDRAAQMALPPASVFKVVTAAALLASPGFDAEAALDCQGFLKQPDRLRCALFRRTGMGHGPTTLADALAQSCNVYFFQAGEALGPKPIAAWAQAWGLGSNDGIEISGAGRGLVPPQTQRTATGEGWKLADTQAFAIGQGRLLVTPVQIARMMAAVANEGQLPRVHVVRGGAGTLGEEQADVEQANEGESKPAPQLTLSPTAWKQLKAALVRVVADPVGTAYDTVHLESIAIAGKTGTAEVGPGRTEHAWFAGFAPAEAPRIAVAVVIEHGGDGGEVAGPVARRLVQQTLSLGYFPRPPAAALMIPPRATTP